MKHAEVFPGVASGDFFMVYQGPADEGRVPIGILNGPLALSMALSREEARKLADYIHKILDAPPPAV